MSLGGLGWPISWASLLNASTRRRAPRVCRRRGHEAGRRRQRARGRTAEEDRRGSASSRLNAIFIQRARTSSLKERREMIDVKLPDLFTSSSAVSASCSRSRGQGLYYEERRKSEPQPPSAARAAQHIGREGASSARPTTSTDSLLGPPYRPSPAALRPAPSRRARCAGEFCSLPQGRRRTARCESVEAEALDPADAQDRAIVILLRRRGARAGLRA